MSSDAAEIPAPAKKAKELQTYTLAQLLAKASEKTTFAADLKYVRDNITCVFETCDEEPVPALLDTKLCVGSHSSIDQTVWAHIRSTFKNCTKASNHVTYLLDNGAVIKNAELKNVTFDEPFSFIESPEHDTGRDKIRNLVLFFFLEHGYMDNIEFAKRGLDSFRIAVANVAKAHAKAKGDTHQSSSTAEPGPSSLQNATCSDTTEQAPASIPAMAADSEVSNATKPTMAGSSKRKQSPDSVDIKAERPAKRAEEDGGVYYLTKLMEHLKGQTSSEIDSLTARNEQLEAALDQLKEQRDRWESDANFAKQQLKDSEQRRHEAEAKLDESKRQTDAFEAVKAKFVKDIEKKNEQLKGWEVAMQLHRGKTEAKQKDLNDLRAFKEQLLDLLANLQRGESAT